MLSENLALTKARPRSRSTRAARTRTSRFIPAKPNGQAARLVLRSPSVLRTETPPEPRRCAPTGVRSARRPLFHSSEAEWSGSRLLTGHSEVRFLPLELRPTRSKVSGADAPPRGALPARLYACVRAHASRRSSTRFVSGVNPVRIRAWALVSSTRTDPTRKVRWFESNRPDRRSGVSLIWASPMVRHSFLKKKFAVCSLERNEIFQDSPARRGPTRKQRLLV